MTYWKWDDLPPITDNAEKNAERWESVYQAFKKRFLEETTPPKFVCADVLTEQEIEKLRNCKPGDIVLVNRK